MGPAAAIEAPRWLVGGMSPEAETPIVVAEAAVPDRTLASLAEAGYRVVTIGELDGAAGHAHMIRATAEGFEAGSDPRADGGAMAS
jgi:gamma-glutamyltranspeptidase